MNAAFESRLNADLDALRAAGTYKRLRHITGAMAPEVHMEEAGDVIVLSSNNYLGLADHPDVVQAGIDGLRTYGAGTASVRFICGTFDVHRDARGEDRVVLRIRGGALVRVVLDGERRPDSDGRDGGQHDHQR